jgi:hypothetical protein
MTCDATLTTSIDTSLEGLKVVCESGLGFKCVRTRVGHLRSLRQKATIDGHRHVTLTHHVSQRLQHQLLHLGAGGNLSHA